VGLDDCLLPNKIRVAALDVMDAAVVAYKEEEATRKTVNIPHDFLSRITEGCGNHTVSPLQPRRRSGIVVEVAHVQ
jgi:hypothetical protein